MLTRIAPAHRPSTWAAACAARLMAAQVRVRLYRSRNGTAGRRDRRHFGRSLRLPPRRRRAGLVARPGRRRLRRRSGALPRARARFRRGSDRTAGAVDRGTGRGARGRARRGRRGAGRRHRRRLLWRHGRAGAGRAPAGAGAQAGRSSRRPPRRIPPRPRSARSSGGRWRSASPAALGEEALSIARGLAMLTYRTPTEFAERFAGGIDGGGHAGDVRPGALSARPRRRLSPDVMTPRALPQPVRLDRPPCRRSRPASPHPALVIGALTDQLVPRRAAARAGRRRCRTRACICSTAFTAMTCSSRKRSRIGALVAPFLERR